MSRIIFINDTDAFAVDLWKRISDGRDVYGEPVYAWAVSDEEFVDLWQFTKSVVIGGEGRYWSRSQEKVPTVYAALFMVWITEDYRRNGTFTQSIASHYGAKLGFSNPADWGLWNGKGESALRRKSIDCIDKFVSRIQQEAGLLRRSFDGYEPGGFTTEDKGNSYWACLLELWDRLDVSEYQILQWRTGRDWYNREARVGGVGFYTQFYDVALDFLRNISWKLLRNPDLAKNPSSLADELQPWVDPSDGLNHFLSDLCGQGAANGGRRKTGSWEPKADRCLYLQGGIGNVCTRLVSPPQIPLLPMLAALGGDRLCLKAYGEVSEYDLGQYFASSGNAYQRIPEQYIAPLDPVRVLLQGTTDTIESILLAPLSEDQPWFFVQESAGAVECWKLVDDVQGKFPILVSLPPDHAISVPTGSLRFDLVQSGIQNRVCVRLESIEDLQASGIDPVKGVGRSLQLVLRPCRQQLQVFWNGRPVPVSMGLPQVATGSRALVERSDSVQGDYQPVRSSEAEIGCGYFRVRAENDVGPAMRLAVLPPTLVYTCSESTPSALQVVFAGLPEGYSLQPQRDLVDGLWDNVPYGGYFEYELQGGQLLRIPSPASGMAWKHLYGREIPAGHATLNMEQDVSLCLDVVRNPAIVNLDVSLVDVRQEVVKIPLEFDFFAPPETGKRTVGRINLGSMGDGIVRKLFSMTNHQDAKVKISGTLTGAGQREERLPELVVHRFDRDKDSDVDLERLWVFPLTPLQVSDASPTDHSVGVWFSVPSVTAGNKKVWNRTHRASGAEVGAEPGEWPDGTLHHILLNGKPWDFMDKILDRLDQDLSEAEWSLIEDSFQLMRDRDIPFVSLWLPQAVLRHDKTLCKLFERQLESSLHKWVLQSSRGRFGTFGFDLRLIRKKELDSTSKACRETLWSEMHLLLSGQTLEEAFSKVEPAVMMRRAWMANPETGHATSELELRWNRLYDCGDASVLDLDDKPYEKWKTNNSLQLKTWDPAMDPNRSSSRISRLNRLSFRDGQDSFAFDSEVFSGWPGFKAAWDRHPKVRVPEWIKATKWLGWFSVHATDPQYRAYLPFALRTMKMLETTDPDWCHAAFPIAQAQAIGA